MDFRKPLCENPLDNVVSDGGYVGIFRKIACIGDSLSSGEFEGTTADGGKSYHDMYEYSWGQFIARAAGCTVYNFSRGGMSAKWYLDSFADERGLWNRDLAAQAYIMALGVNDISAMTRGELEMGTLDDIDPKDWHNNKLTFIGYYATIIQRYREIAPDSFFFLMTIPKKDDSGDRLSFENKHRELLYGLAEMFPNIYILDLYKYAPVYGADFRHDFFLGGHLNPMGYKFTADMVIAYIDHIIRSDMRRFGQVGFINTPWKNAEK